MRRARVIPVVGVLCVVAACTSAQPLTAGSRSAPAGGSVSGPVAAGLQPVKDYAQEFCSGAAVATRCPKGSVPEALRRPLHLPRVAPGAPCPASEANPRIWARAAPGLGPGPVAPVGLGEHALLGFRRFPGSEWGGQKVLWVAMPGYDGPVLIRGGSVDGSGGVGFNVNGSGPPLAELQLPPGNEPERSNRGGYREWPSYTRVLAPGCYAYQVDGANFSYVIVFQAKLTF